MMKKSTPLSTAMGSFTDFNVWKVELSDEQMKQFTECGTMMRGDLIPWNISDWMFTPDIQPDEYQLETVQFDNICSPTVNFYAKFVFYMLEFQEKLILFPERIRFQDSINLCESFGGTLVITETEEDYIQVDQ